MNPEISALRKVSVVCSYFACLNLPENDQSKVSAMI